MEEKMNLLSLKDLANGALQEKADAAMQNIKNYLEFELADYKDQFTVIS